MICMFDFDNINKWVKEVLSHFTKTKGDIKLQWRTSWKFINWPTKKGHACHLMNATRLTKSPRDQPTKSIHSWHYDISIHYIWFIILLHFSHFPFLRKCPYFFSNYVFLLNLTKRCSSILWPNTAICHGPIEYRGKFLWLLL